MAKPESAPRLGVSRRHVLRTQARRRISAVRRNREPYERQILLLTESLDAVLTACEAIEAPQDPEPAYARGYLDALAEIEFRALNDLLPGTITTAPELDEDPS